jgi:hypothetical protein
MNQVRSGEATEPVLKEWGMGLGLAGMCTERSTCGWGMRRPAFWASPTRGNGKAGAVSRRRDVHMTLVQHSACVRSHAQAGQTLAVRRWDPGV